MQIDPAFILIGEMNGLDDLDDLVLLLAVRIREIHLQDLEQLLGCQVYQLAKNLVNAEDDRKNKGQDESDFASVGFVRAPPCRSAGDQAVHGHAPGIVPGLLSHDHKNKYGVCVNLVQWLSK